MDSVELVMRLMVAFVFGAAVIFFAPLRRWWKAKRYTRGRSEVRTSKNAGSVAKEDSVRWGNSWIPRTHETQHFLVMGTTGSGKSNILRLMLERPLRFIREGSDSRALLFDAKQDAGVFLRHLGVRCPVFSLNPFEAGCDVVEAVSWDVAKDVTSPARAQNLASSLIPSPKEGGNNQYFIDAARQVVIGIAESFIRHSPTTWTFSDLVFASLSQERIEEILKRDSEGRDVLSGFFGDERTSYQVFTTVCSRMSYYRPVAALWQRAERRLSVREWLRSESILLLGCNATARTSLDAINGEIFRVLVEEIDVQTNSSSRRTYVSIDEARLASSLLKPELLPFLAVKGRSKGVSISLAYQDQEGMRDAAGPRIADELVAQFSHQAFLRMQSEPSAKLAASQCGQYETLEHFASDSSSLSQSVSTQRVVKDAVLPVQFMQIPPSSPRNGVTGYFLSPEFGCERATVPGGDVAPIVVSEEAEKRHAIQLRSESEQWLREWKSEDRERLQLRAAEQAVSLDQDDPVDIAEKKRLRLRLGRSRTRGISSAKDEILCSHLSEYRQ